MPPSRRAAFDRSMVVPTIIGFVVGFVAGTLLESPLVGVALGAGLAMSALGRRYAAARMGQSRVEPPVGGDRRRR
jgi:mannose/fructose/N-acetylgalactosamine-specific phosphotransferase system component IIC